jgi:hypothetical protein
MACLQLLVALYSIYYIFICFNFRMLINYQRIKDFALVAEYDTMNTMRG